MSGSAGRTLVWAGLTLALAGSIRAELAKAPDAAVEAVDVVRLRERIGELERQVEDLTLWLAQARLALDRMQVEQGLMGPSAARVAGRTLAADWQAAVLEVNSELALVVLDGGAPMGLRPGLRIAVLRGAEVIARAQVVEVRDRISGARIERLLGDKKPQTGDRAIVWRSSM